MPVSPDMFREVRCYIEEYEGVPGVPSTLSARLREKGTGRRVEVSGTEADGEELLELLASPKAHGLSASIPNVYEASGYRDYVFVSGIAEIDASDLIRLTHDNRLTIAFM